LWSGNFEPTFAEFISRELNYAPAAFASSAYWAVAFIVGTTIYRIYQQAEAPNALTNQSVGKSFRAIGSSYGLRN
ncbi:MAG: hypothetical protein VXA68_09495, partial [Gammaproteobacteria bacterium]